MDHKADRDAVQYNRQAWDRLALEGDRFYRAVTSNEIEEARRGKYTIRLTPTRPVPGCWLADIQDRKILCLAGGGARQGPLLAAAGAKVTVFDLSEKQLERDRKIAENEDLDVATMVGDMRDLACFGDRSFDLIVSPCATCFCPDVQSIWNECHRVLRNGGRFMIGFFNPIHFVFDQRAMLQNRFVVRHSIPYSDLQLSAGERRELIGPDRPLEFGHSLEMLIGGQLRAGFQLVDFFEDGWGGSDPLSQKIATFCATLAEKPAS